LVIPPQRVLAVFEHQRSASGEQHHGRDDTEARQAAEGCEPACTGRGSVGGRDAHPAPRPLASIFAAPNRRGGLLVALVNVLLDLDLPLDGIVVVIDIRGIL
jgi:hypothetical protein